MLRNLRQVAVWAVIAVAGIAVSGTAAHAGYGDAYGNGHNPHYGFKKVVVYVVKQVPVVKRIKIYDDYGYPQFIEKTFYKTIQVPVVKYVKVGY